MAMAVFWPTQLTYQSRLIVNLFNFCVFIPILIRFGLKANIGLRTWNEFWITMAILWPNGPTNRSQPIVNLFNFCLSTIWMKFGMWTTPTLLLSCSFPAPALLLPCSSFSPARAVLLPCFFQAPIWHVPSSSPVPAQLPGPCEYLPGGIWWSSVGLKSWDGRINGRGASNYHKRRVYVLLHGKVSSPCPIHWTKRL